MKREYSEGVLRDMPQTDPELKVKDLEDEDVQWVVNDLSELGVKIGNKTFFLYKGNSYNGGEYYRAVGKREFGECCHPWSSFKERDKERRPANYVGYHGEQLELWEKK